MQRFLIRCAATAAISLAASMLLAADLTVAVISDVNSSYGSTDYGARVQSAVRRIIEIQPDIVLCAGDMVAGQRTNPHLPESQVEDMWSAFHQRITRPLQEAGIPLAVVAGNHDGSASKSFALEREIFIRQWKAHRPKVAFVDDAHFPLHYAFSVGKTLFIGLDATIPGALAPAQRAWLDQLLREKGQEYVHRIVVSHLPMWPFSVGRERQILRDQALERILIENRVTAFVSGHHHAFFPGTNNGMLHLGTASLAGGTRRIVGTNRKPEHSFTVIRFSGNGLSVEALAAPNFSKAINLKSLPPRMHGENGDLIRWDLSNNTPADPGHQGNTQE